MKQIIERICQNQSESQGPYEFSKEDTSAIEALMASLDTGKIRVCEKKDGVWETNAWVKEGILLYFKIAKMQEFQVPPFSFYDKIPLKTNFRELNVRVVPHAVARYGSYMEPNVVLMPSYVNIGAYIGQRTMVDTWATVGSCAQIGQDVHLSGGVGIGGVLEPPSAQPVIVEDGAFIGSRAIIVEGFRVGREAVVAANTTLTSSIPIIDTRGPTLNTLKGYIPDRCVVVPGVREKEVPGGKIYIACAYILGERKESTDRKSSLNQVLRDFSLAL